MPTSSFLNKEGKMKNLLKRLKKDECKVQVLFNGHQFTGYIKDIKRRFFSLSMPHIGVTKIRDEMGMFPIKEVAIFYDIK